MAFTEVQLERAVTELLGAQGYSHVPGASLLARSLEDVLIRQDLQDFLSRRYQAEGLSASDHDGDDVRQG